MQLTTSSCVICHLNRFSAMKKSMSSSTTATSTATTSYKEKTFSQIWLSDSGVSCISLVLCVLFELFL